MKITLVVEGRIRSGRAQEWIETYQKRLEGQMPLSIIQWGSTHKQKESKFFASLKPDEMTAALDENGKSFKSTEFAAHLGELRTVYRQLYLFLGEAEGHSDTVLENVREKWSLSPMTMSYEVTLVMVCEQLYRALTILTGHPYHK